MLTIGQAFVLLFFAALGYGVYRMFGPEHAVLTGGDGHTHTVCLSRGTGSGESSETNGHRVRVTAYAPEDNTHTLRIKRPWEW
jgi:hypothetical protein